MTNETLMLLSVDEAARRVGLGRSKFYSELRAGRVATVRIGRARRVSVKALERFVAQLELEARQGEQPGAVSK